MQHLVSHQANNPFAPTPTAKWCKMQVLFFKNQTNQRV